MSLVLTSDSAAVIERGSAMTCAACKAITNAGRPVLRANGGSLPFDLHKCRACGLVQQQPRETASRLAAHYDGDYYVFQEAEPLRWARAVQQFLVHLRPLETRAPKRLLDVGCAMGHLCALAKRRGWRVSGLDISADAVSKAVVQFGIDARAGRLSQYLQTFPRFDVVMLGDVIEHVENPASLLRDVRRCLAPGGTVCIDTPNWGGWRRRIGRSRWLGINPFHVNLFNTESLSSLLERCGFGDIRVASYTHYRHASLASRPELQPLIRRAPAALAWRLNALFDRVARRDVWAELRRTPPDSLEAAATTVDRLSRKGRGANRRQWGDNLAMNARLTA